MAGLSEHCLHFTPFTIDNDQFECIHGANENVDVAVLPQAVEFYKYFIKEAQTQL